MSSFMILEVFADSSLEFFLSQANEEEDLCKVATQAEEALGEVDIVLSSSSSSLSSYKSSWSLWKLSSPLPMVIYHHVNITITKMVEIVEELMIAVLGGSAEIVGWPEKVVLCAAGVSISWHCRGIFQKYFSALQGGIFLFICTGRVNTSKSDKSIFTWGLNIVQHLSKTFFSSWSPSQRSAENPSRGLSTGLGETHMWKLFLEKACFSCFLDALASLDFTLVSESVSRQVVVSSLRHLSP